MDVDTIFKMLMDSSIYVTSDLNKMVGSVDEKTVKQIIQQLHLRTKTNGLLDNENELLTLATIISIRIYKCIKVYIGFFLVRREMKKKLFLLHLLVYCIGIA